MTIIMDYQYLVRKVDIHAVRYDDLALRPKGIREDPLLFSIVQRSTNPEGHQESAQRSDYRGEKDRENPRCDFTRMPSFFRVTAMSPSSSVERRTAPIFPTRSKTGAGAIRRIRLA